MDAAQAIVTKVFARAIDFEPGRAALPWFYAIASGELRTITRRRHVARSRNVDADAADTIRAVSTPEDDILDAEMRAALERAVALLDGPSAQAIAELLCERPPDVPRATFRKRLSRAIAKLRILMREADAD